MLLDVLGYRVEEFAREVFTNRFAGSMSTGQRLVPLVVVTASANPFVEK